MIHCEEKLLKSIIADIKDYTLAHQDDVSFYRDIGDLKRLSLQRVSLQSDSDYFDDINSVLNVITTIIVHPHIVNARNTIILRAEQAHGLTPEMFMDTVRDQKLWKDKRGVMTPSEVYYFENVDDLKNYENRFIVHLLDIISSQLSDYVKFYDFILGKLIQGTTLTRDNSTMEKQYNRLDTLAKKVRRIKNTYFYREVSKANTNFTRIESTNVLKHNRAYAFCYRFYVENVSYGDEQARATDMAVYYFTRLLLALNSYDFTLVATPQETNHTVAANNQTANRRRSSKNEPSIVRPMTFENSDFVVSLENASKYGGLFVTVEPKVLGATARARNLLVFDSTISFEEVQKNLEKYPNSGATAVDAVNLWDAAYVENSVVSLNLGRMSESMLLRRYVKDKTRILKASRNIYQTHCPACGSRDVIGVSEHQYKCKGCGTHYTFIDDNIWFTKLRRS